ncbi:MAG: 50S ribosomal protein L4 [bacterium ADurb.Bin270]|nr:MAG: 50S ribosomal protein L4 [bacterium ADurb.Bin270]
MKEIKTKPVVAFLKTLGVESCLLVVDAKDEKLEKSVRNIKHLKLVRAEGINVYDLLRYDHAIIMKQALEKVQEVLKP